MHRIPFGVRRLDSTIGGGAPPGSVVLLSGEPGAGSREFMYTSAVMCGVATVDEDLFDLYYGSLDPAAEAPDEVHYVTFTQDERKVEREMTLTMDDDVVREGLNNVTFHDLSADFFRLSPVPREWYAETTQTIADLGQHSERSSVPEALGDTLNDHAPGNLVIIDSLTDLVGAMEEFTWSDVATLLRGLTRIAFQWEGLVLVHVNNETLDALSHGQLVDASDGSFVFSWEQGGSSLARIMVVKQFRGVLSRLEEEEIVRFETDISDAGFDISDVRKIR